MRTTLSLQIDAISPDALTPYRVDGAEALSTLYAWDVECTAAGGDLLGPEILGRRAVLTLAVDSGPPRLIPGVVGRIAIQPPTIDGDVVYRLRITPDVSRLCLSRHNHVFGTESPVSVADILMLELSGAARRGSLAADTDLGTFQNELRLKQAYPSYNQIVQYEETNFAFISRLAEHWGIFYFFDVLNGRDRAIFTDDNIFAPVLDGGGELAWQPWITGTHVSVPDRIFMLDASYDPAPQRVYLRDYNEKLPKLPLVASQGVDPQGHGHWVEYGAHHRTPDEGALLARVRAEELLCRRVRFNGRSTAPQLTPGRVFSLDGHPYAAWNQQYLIVSVQHRARVPQPAIATGADEPNYDNSFTAIPLGVQFRPERTTPRPRVEGLLNGRVEATQVLPHPDLDGNGYYRVRLPVDMSDVPSGQASQWVRKAEPYGGPANGMHFPLPAGTDVVLGHVNGDPDRPIILGAVPSADNLTVVGSANAQMNRIRTRSGMQMTFSDAPTPSGND